MFKKGVTGSTASKAANVKSNHVWKELFQRWFSRRELVHLMLTLLEIQNYQSLQTREEQIKLKVSSRRPTRPSVRPPVSPSVRPPGAIRSDRPEGGATAPETWETICRSDFSHRPRLAKTCQQYWDDKVKSFSFGMQSVWKRLGICNFLWIKLAKSWEIFLLTINVLRFV